MKGQSRERMRSESRRQEMAGSGSSPSHPCSLVPLTGGWRQIGGWGGGYDLGLHVGLHSPISTTEKAAAYTRPLGCVLNSKFFLYIIHVNSKDQSKANVT